MHFDLIDLRLYLHILDTGNITAGAARSHLSLAAASTRLQQLEHALGATLLLRSKQGVRTTDAGRTLLQHAGRLQRDMEALHADMGVRAKTAGLRRLYTLGPLSAAAAIRRAGLPEFFAQRLEEGR